MAGPGGGPPRKSHTKSRKGCKTCKRRHIRCDESFPQCRNCTKHNCRCDYMDTSHFAEGLSQNPKGPNLLWTPQIEREVDLWQRTGHSPFSELQLQPPDQFRGLSSIDLRLIHHLSSIYRDLERVNVGRCTLWVEEIPSFLNASNGYDYVLSSILAFSATHLAWTTKSSETKNLAYYHRGVALKGLHGAIGKFSKENSDPVLAASIILSWQASDWGGWTSLMRGISTVVSSMTRWKDYSKFSTYIERHPTFFSRKSVQPPSIPFDDESLLLASSALQRLSSQLANTHPLSRRLQEILDFTEEIQTCSATMRSEQLFEKLQPLRTWLFWMPTALAEPDKINISEMILLAQLYTVALAIDTSIPELGGAALGSLTLRAIQEIDNIIRQSQPTNSKTCAKHIDTDEMMQFSRLMLARHQLEDSGSHESYQMQKRGPRSSYGYQHLGISSQPSTPGFAPGTPAGYPAGATYFPAAFSSLSSHSFEDLSVPASPYLRYSSPVSRPRSQLLEASPRLSDVSFEKRSSSGYSFKGESPAYSPAYVDDDSVFMFGGHSPSHLGGFVFPATELDSKPNRGSRDYRQDGLSLAGKQRQADQTSCATKGDWEDT